jgi:hypothetical protein
MYWKWCGGSSPLGRTTKSVVTGDSYPTRIAFSFCVLTSEDVTANLPRIAFHVFLLAVASVLLYFGLGMLLLVPGDPGGPYWVRERIVYGLLPFFSSLIFIAFSTWLAARRERADLFSCVKWNLICAGVGAVVVFVLLILNDAYFHVPLPKLR